MPDRPFDAGNWPRFSCGIEPRHEGANECLFPMARGFFGTALVPFDARHAMEQADHAARESFRVGDAIAGQALAQVARLAHVQDAFGIAAHEVNAGAAGKRAEKFLAQPLDERFRRWKKPELSGSHGEI